MHTHVAYAYVNIYFTSRIARHIYVKKDNCVLFSVRKLR